MSLKSCLLEPVQQQFLDKRESKHLQLQFASKFSLKFTNCREPVAAKTCCTKTNKKTKKQETLILNSRVEETNMQNSNFKEIVVLRQWESETKIWFCIKHLKG